jgi:hypothetical protein
MNKLFCRLGKKGGSDDFAWIFLFWRMGITCFVAIALLLMVKLYIVSEINIQETHADLFVNNILNTEEGLSYFDAELDRVYPNTILVSSFAERSDLGEVLNNRMDYGEESIVAAKLTLFTIDQKNLGTVYYNQDWYERWIVLAKTLWKGPGSATEHPQNRTVLLLYDDGTKEPGILEFSVVMPNSY